MSGTYVFLRTWKSSPLGVKSFLTFSPSREDIHGQTPLYIASQSGQFAIARALIQKGVDVNVKTSSGDTPCHAARRNGYTAIANLITEHQQLQLNPINTAPKLAENSKQPKPTHLHLAPPPTRFKPKSPYTAFFERFTEFPDPETNPIPEVVVDDFDDKPSKPAWFPSPVDITRYSPEGIESAMDAFNPFNAWPGTSMIFKQAIASNNTTASTTNSLRPSHFKKSIAKPSSNISQAHTPASPISPWSPTGERYPVMGSNDIGNTHQEDNFVKLPKDLSSILANLGLAKYQMHFEEQDIDLQVILFYFNVVV